MTYTAKTYTAKSLVFAAVIAAAGNAAADERTVALVYGITGDAFYVTMERGAREKAEELGVELISDGPSQWNPAVQTPIIDAMIARDIDALIAVPNDPQAMIAVLERANNMGIPIVTADQYIGDGDYENGSVTFPLSYIASDNFNGGKLACETLITEMGGNGTLYILVSTPNVPTDIARRDGCLAAAEAAGDGVVVAGVDYTESNATKATNLTQAALQRNPDIGAIFGGNLFSAQGAAAAVKTANLTGAVRIASFDAPQQAIDDLRNGVVDIVIAQQPALIGAMAVQYLVDALDGNVDDIPASFATPFVIITRENVDSPEAQDAIYKD